MQGNGKVLGTKAPDFLLKDHLGTEWKLSDAVKAGSALLVFYPGDFKLICTRQMCNYRDAFPSFQNLNINLLAISSNSPESHLEFSKQYELPFPLLSDPKQTVADAYGCRSIFMLGAISRAVCIVNHDGFLLYRYVEPTTATRRKSEELIGILQDLKSHNLI